MLTQRQETGVPRQTIADVECRDRVSRAFVVRSRHETFSAFGRGMRDRHLPRRRQRQRDRSLPPARRPYSRAMIRVLQTVDHGSLANVFMTWAWYGHLRRRLAAASGGRHFWLIALPEYARKCRRTGTGTSRKAGPSRAQRLKIQEAITLTVFGSSRCSC